MLAKTHTGLAVWWWTESRVPAECSWYPAGLDTGCLESLPEQSSTAYSAWWKERLSRAVNATSLSHRLRMPRPPCLGNHWGPYPHQLTACDRMSAVAGPGPAAVLHRSAGMVWNQDRLDHREIYRRLPGPRTVLQPRDLQTDNKITLTRKHIENARLPLSWILSNVAFYAKITLITSGSPICVGMPKTVKTCGITTKLLW